MIVAFGRFRFDSGMRELLAGAEAAHLSPKAFDVLKLLLERRPNVVDKREIYRAVWPDTFVGDATIRTVHRVGYAFAFEPVVDLAGAVQPDRPSPSRRCWLSVNDRTFHLTEGENVVGRDPQCTVWLDESGVSRRHARIVVAGTSATLEDLKSKNGTFVRGRGVKQPRELADGDVIQFGSTEARFTMWSEGQAPETVRLDRRRTRS